jgi:hypothetical protein
MSDEPRTKRVHYMATGTLQNSPCVPCQRDTTHKGGVCLECGAGTARPARRGRESNRKPVKS